MKGSATRLSTKVAVCLLMVCALTMCLLNGMQSTVFAAEADLYQYVISDEGTVTIQKYIGMESSVIVPATIEGYPVTVIGWAAFSSSAATLENVVVPEGVTELDGYAFGGCYKLKSIALPESLVSIGTEAFAYCDALESVQLSKNVTNLGEDAFYSCENLKTVLVDAENTVYQSIDGALLKGNTELLWCSPKQKGVFTVPEGVTQIAKGAFHNCAELEQIILPEGLVSIGRGAFADCSALKSMELPDSVTDIGSWAFRDCALLERVVILDGLTSIETGLFFGCSQLTQVVLPGSVTTIGEEAFSDCRMLQEIVIPEGVATIGIYAFRKCSSLESVVIPASVTNIGAWAFVGSNSLKNIVVANSNAEYCAVEDVLFNKDQTELIRCSVAKSGSYTVPDSVMRIYDSAFANCSTLTEVVLADGVTDIGTYAFADCTALTDAVIPEGVSTLSEGLFNGCSSLKNITIPKTVTHINNGVLDECSSLENITVDKENENYSATDGVLFDKTQTELLLYPAGRAGAYTIPDGVAEIEQEAFLRCVNLQQVTIPGSVTEIGERAFRWCENLETVEMADGVKEIGQQAFAECAKLKSIAIPKSVTSIGDFSFYACAGLNSITVDEANEAYCAIDNVLFNKGQTKLILCAAAKEGRYTVPEGVIWIGSDAFWGCNQLKSIVLPESVSTIGEDAFDGCAGLESIEIPADAAVFRSAFDSCVSLQHIVYGGSEKKWAQVKQEADSAVLEAVPTIHYNVSPGSAVAVEEIVPSCTTEGGMVYHCTVCDYGCRIVTADSPGHDIVNGVCTRCDQPEAPVRTPDEREQRHVLWKNILIAVIVITVAAGVVFFLLRYRKKRGERV